MWKVIYFILQALLQSKEEEYISKIDINGIEKLHFYKPKSNDFSYILRDVLGYDAVYDPGSGVIHINEPYQIFALKPNVIKIVDKIVKSNKTSHIGLIKNINSNDELEGYGTKTIAEKEIKNTVLENKNINSVDSSFKNCDFLKCTFFTASGLTFLNCKFIDCRFVDTIYYSYFVNCFLENVSFRRCQIKYSNIFRRTKFKNIILSSLETKIDFDTIEQWKFFINIDEDNRIRHSEAMRRHLKLLNCDYSENSDLVKEIFDLCSVEKNK